MKIDYNNISGYQAYQILNSGTADSDINVIKLWEIVKESLFRLEQLEK